MLMKFMNLLAKVERVRPSTPWKRICRFRENFTAPVAVAVLTLTLAFNAFASENEPRRPFAQMADLPEPGQFVWGTLYEQSEAYYAWQQGNNRANITVKANNGESYGIDIRQGYFTFDYGIKERWAADLNLGFTTVGWRSFNPDAGISETTGMMDVTFGVRYQIFNEALDTNSPWIPTLTFRAGGILPGFYDENLAFAPGNHGAGIEPSILFRKHFGWTGFGGWGDLLYRWEHTTGNDQYITAVGFFQQIKGWELDVGYRHLQATAGSDIIFFGPQAPYNGISYPRDTREVSDSMDAGFSYTTQKRHVRWGFHARKTFDGSNTDSKLWLGGYVDIPFGGKKKQD
jgi:hypothetical protein